MSDTQSEPSAASDEGKEEVKSVGQKRTVFRCILALLVFLLLCGAILTWRVNVQREAVQWVLDSGGNVTYRIERDSTLR